MSKAKLVSSVAGLILEPLNEIHWLIVMENAAHQARFTFAGPYVFFDRTGL